MVGRIILLILLLLILLIFFVPYGVDAGYEQGVAFVRVKAGPLRFTLWPKKPKAKKKKPRKEKKKKASKDKDDKPASGEAQGTDETITVKKKKEFDLDFILALIKMGAHALRRLLRSFSIDLLRVHYTVAGRDPYNVAMQYGRLCAAVEELPALCGNKVRVRKKDIVLASDFLETSPTIEARIVLSLQLYKIVHLAVVFLVEYLVWKTKDRRAQKAAASLERKDDNGRQQDQ